MRRLLPLLLILFVADLSAQQLPLYTQYVFNPYMLNPSMVAFSGRPEINFLYRQQWSNIDDGPKTLQFDGQYRLNDKMGIGLYLNQDRTVLLSSTMAMLTYGYRVTIAENHVIGFGLSAGMFQNRIRSEDAAPVDQNDPALMTSVSNNMALDGQFGVHYRTGGFTLGYSLVNLVDHKYISNESFQKPKFSQLKNQIVFASYRFNVIPGTLALQPNAAYRLSENNTNFFEGSLIASIKGIVDVGGGYRQDFGPTAMARVTYGPISAGFAYDFPSNTGLISPGGTKEIQVKWRFGKAEVEETAPAKKSRRAARQEEITTPPAAPVENTKPTESEKQPEKPQENPVVTEQPKKEEPVKQENIEQQNVEVKKEPVKEEPKPVVVEPKKEPVVVTPPAPTKHYYYIIKTFHDHANADKFLKEVRADGFKAELKEVFSPEHYYYIHLPEYKSDEISLEKLQQLQKKTGFKDGWFKELE